MPRTIKLAVAPLLACGLVICAVNAQERGVRPKLQPSPADSKQTSKSKSGAQARARKENGRAVALLLEVAGDARAIESIGQRAGILTFCADALWDADEQSARSIFRRAWETATESDAADWSESLREDGRAGDSPERYTAARSLVLTLAAKHDARMAEPFLHALDDWLTRQADSARDASNAAEKRHDAALDHFTPDGHRLSLAYSLLDEEAYANAAAVVEPMLTGGINSELILFLLRLRERAPVEADRLYMRLLTATRADASANANDVLLLSSYVLAPRLLAAVNEDGSIKYRLIYASGADAQGSAAVGRVRVAFFDAAASILLRPARGKSSGSSTANYFVVGRLLPFFEREAPQYAPALHARLSSLVAEVEAARREALDSQMSSLNQSPSNMSDPLRPYLEEVERAHDSRSRDVSRLFAAKEAAKRKLWDRARKLAEEIEGDEPRREARFHIAARQVAGLQEAFADNEGDDFEKAAAFVRQTELPPALRAYGFAVAAELAARHGKRVRAEALLDEAFGYVQETENRTAMREAAMLVTATVAARIDSPRTWAAVAAAVAAINEDAEFGNSPSFKSLLQGGLSPGERETLDEVFEPYTLDGLLAEATEKNFDRGVTEARNIKNGLLRAQALIAVAETRLAKNSEVRTGRAR